MGNVKTTFIKPLTRQFTLPKGATEDVEEWGKDYQRILGTFDDEILARAADLIIVSRDKSTFPLPSECNRACLDAMEMLAGERTRASKAKEGSARAAERVNQADWERRTQRADALFAVHPKSTEACKGEWWWRLWSWMQEHGRNPDIHELRQIEAKGKADYAKYLEDIKDNIFAKQLNNWRNIAYRRISGLIREKSDESRHQAVGADR